MKDHELRSARDIQRLKESHEIEERDLKQQVTKLETIRTALERVNLIINCFINVDHLFFLTQKSGNKFLEIHRINTKVTS